MVEASKQYSDTILSHLLKTLNAARDGQTLPDSMTQANIVLLLKPDNDPLDLGSYRPISLLQKDIKILAKVLALRLNTEITSLIHPDQSGFIPERSTAINLRWLFVYIQSQVDNTGNRALLSLDDHKAFNSVEWQYLWATMLKFGFRPVFLSWVHLLYSTPKAVIREAGHVSSAFPIGVPDRDALCLLSCLPWP